MTRTLTFKAIILLQAEGFVCYYCIRLPFGATYKKGLLTQGKIKIEKDLRARNIKTCTIHTDTKHTNRQTNKRTNERDTYFPLAHEELNCLGPLGILNVQ